MRPLMEQLEFRECPSITHVSVPWGDVYAGGPHSPDLVQIYQQGKLAAQFFAFTQKGTFRGGVQLGSTDADGDSIPDLLLAAGPGAGPELKVLSGVNLKTLVDIYTRPWIDFAGVTAQEVDYYARVLHQDFLTFRTLEDANYWLSQHQGQNHNVTDLILLSQAAQEQNKIPAWLQEALYKSGARLVLMVGNGATDYPPFAYLKGVPVGYGLDDTWDTHPGGTVAFGPTLVLLNQQHRISSVSAVLHEQGIQVGWVLAETGHLSGKPEWDAIQKGTDFTKFLSPTIEGFYYKNPIEAFAECFAMYLYSDATRRDLPQSIRGYFARLLGV